MIKKKDEGFWSKKNTMSLIIVFLMISSVLAIWQGSQSTSTIDPYNDHDITFSDEGFVIESDYGEIHGYSYPSSLEAISFDAALVQYLRSSSQVVVLFDPDDPSLEYIEILRSDLAVDDFPSLAQEASFTITTNSSLYSYPVLDCASTPLPTLYIHTANASPQIYQEEGCVVLEASRWEDLFKLKDRVVYTLAGIMAAS